MVLKYSAIPTPATTISRNFIHSIVENVLANLEIEDPKILFLGQAYDNASQPNSTAGEVQDVSFGNTERVFVEVSEERNAESAFTRALGYDYAVPIFYDPEANCKISPNYVGYDVTITISRRAAARSMLGGWTNSILAKIDQGMDQFLTQGTMHYRVPNAAMNLINAVYNAKYEKLPTANKPTLRDYIKQYAAPALTVVTNDAGKKPIFVIRSTECRILGFLSQDDVTREKANDTGAWKSTFTFRFTYLRPEIMNLSYCVMVNNSILADKWWHDDDYRGISDESRAVKDIYTSVQDRMCQDRRLLNIPIYLPDCDRPDLHLYSRLTDEVDLFRGYLMFDMEGVNRLPIFNLKSLDGEYSLSYNIIKYVRQRLKMTGDYNMHDGMLRVVVFKNGYEMVKKNVRLDDDLNVYLDDPIDITAVYNFSICLQTTFMYLKGEELEVCRVSPGIIVDVIRQFHPTLVGDAETVTPNENLEDPDLGWIPGWIPDMPDPDDPDIDIFPWRPDPEWPDYKPDPDNPFDPDNPIYPLDPDRDPYPEIPLDNEIIDNVVDDTTTEDLRDPDKIYRNNYIGQLMIVNNTIVSRRRE